MTTTECYTFIYDAEMVKKCEEIFLHPYPTEFFTLHLASRYHKVKELKDIEEPPLQDAWYSRILRPHSLEKYSHYLLKVIQREFHRPIGGFDPYDQDYKLPSKAFAIYLAINPKDPAKAWNTHISDVMKIALETTFHNIDHLAQTRKLMYTPLDLKFVKILDSQRSIKWFHFETDVKKEEVFLYLRKIIEEFNLAQPITIETMHGYHFLWNVQSLTEKWKSVCTALFDTCPTYKVETTNRKGVTLLKENKLFTKQESGRIPVPGTLQYGFPVKFIFVPE